MKKLALLFILITAISCAAIRGIDMSDVSLGMTKNEVQAKKKSFHTKMIGAKKYADGNMEVLQISEIYRTDGQINDYWLYFFNDRLVYNEPINSVQWQAQNWNYKLDDVYYSLKNK